jgi:NTE family protein
MATVTNIALALGGGGVRGVAHIIVLEAIEELGLEVNAAAGSSIGSIVAALHASRLSGADIREHLLRMAGKKSKLLSNLFSSHAVSLARIRRPDWSPIDCEALLEKFLPCGVAADFDELRFPLHVIATDLAQEQSVVFSRGPLVKALAASSAIPGLMRPVRVDGRILVDGAVLDPVPVRHIPPASALVVAVDLTGEAMASRHDGRRLPHAVVTAMESVQMMSRFIATSRLAQYPPAVVLRPAVGKFRATEFHRARQILRELAPFKDVVKRTLDRLLDADARFAHGQKR